MLVGKTTCHYLWGGDRKISDVHSLAKRRGPSVQQSSNGLGLHEGLVARLARWGCGGALLGRHSQVLRRRELVLCIHRAL